MSSRDTSALLRFSASGAILRIEEARKLIIPAIAIGPRVLDIRRCTWSNFGSSSSIEMDFSFPSNRAAELHVHGRYVRRLQMRIGACVPSTRKDANIRLRYATWFRLSFRAESNRWPRFLGDIRHRIALHVRRCTRRFTNRWCGARNRILPANDLGWRNSRKITEVSSLESWEAKTKVLHFTVQK